MWEIQIGDIFFDKYKIIEKIGQGGFGVVYKVLDYGSNTVKALKAIRPDIVLSDEAKYRYIKEAEVWIKLEYHPFIVLADVVKTMNFRLDRIFIITEYIEPGTSGMNSLESYISSNQIDLRQILTWSIQFCYGIEYAYSKNIKAHRDIKPSNIMIDKFGNVRINDFGLAGTINTIADMNMHNSELAGDSQTLIGIGAGTPQYMSPEQFVDVASCDQQSDIYSFGVVLYQMVSGGELPFNATNNAQYWQIMKYQHETANIPTLNSPLLPLIKQCMEKNPDDRIQSFSKLRLELEGLLSKLYNEKVNCQHENPAPIYTLIKKGASSSALGNHLEAIDYYDKALALNPTDINLLSVILNNKASALNWIERFDEALELCDKAISLKEYAMPWANKGIICFKQGKYKEAIDYYDKAIELYPTLSRAYFDKGRALNELKLYDEALHSYSKAININPKHVNAIYNKGLIYYNISKFSEAMRCFDDALAIDSNHFDAWNYKASTLIKLGRFSEAMDSLNVVLEKEPSNLLACQNMAFALFSTSNFKRALIVINHALSINGTDKWAIDFRQSVLAKLNPAIKPIPSRKTNNDASIAGKISKFIGGFLR